MESSRRFAAHLALLIHLQKRKKECWCCSGSKRSFKYTTTTRGVWKMSDTCRCQFCQQVECRRVTLFDDRPRRERERETRKSQSSTTIFRYWKRQPSENWTNVTFSRLRTWKKGKLTTTTTSYSNISDGARNNNNNNNSLRLWMETWMAGRTVYACNAI